MCAGKAQQDELDCGQSFQKKGRISPVVIQMTCGHSESGFFFSLCVWTIMIILKKSTSLIQFFFTLGHVICQLIWKSPFTGSFPCLLWFFSVYCIKAKVLRLNFETLRHQIHSTLSRSSPTDGLFSLPQKEAACSAMTLWAWVTRIPWNFITPYINMIS